MREWGSSNAGVNFSETQLTFSYPAWGGEGYIYLITRGWGGLNPKIPPPWKAQTPLSQILRRWNRTRRVVGRRERERRRRRRRKKKVDRFVRGSLVRSALLLGAI